MIFGQDRNELRRMYVDAWRKSLAGTPLSALEEQISRVVAAHPEYQPLLNDDALEAEFAPESGHTNPFLHMGLHLAIRDQVTTDKPTGIRNIFNALCSKLDDTHEVEHRMLECLAEALWTAQREHRPPDEAAYLESLRRLT